MNYNILDSIAQCSYPPMTRDYVANVVLEISSSDKNTKFYKITKDGNKILVVHYKVKVPFKNKDYDISILIYLPKDFPRVPPEVFLERYSQDIGVNPKNTDIDQNSFQIRVASLNTWNAYSSITNLLGEIQASFRRNFPIFKITHKSNQLINSNDFSHINKNFDQINMNTSSMQSQPQNNINPNWNFNNQNQGGNYLSWNQNSEQRHPPYSNPINQFNDPKFQNPYTSYNNNIYQNNTNQFNVNPSYYSNYNTYNPQQINPINTNPINPMGNQFPNNYNNVNIEKEIRKKLIEEIKAKVEGPLKEEIRSLKKEEECLGIYKIEFETQISKYSNFLVNKESIMERNRQLLIEINNEINRLHTYVADAKDKIIDDKNIDKFLNIQNVEIIKIIAMEATIEDVLSITKKLFDKGILNFDESFKLFRALSGEIIRIRFYRDKLLAQINKFKN